LHHRFTRPLAVAAAPSNVLLTRHQMANIPSTMGPAHSH